MERLVKVFFPEHFLIGMPFVLFLHSPVVVYGLISFPTVFGVSIASFVAVILLLGSSRLMAELLDLKRYLINWYFGCE